MKCFLWVISEWEPNLLESKTYLISVSLILINLLFSRPVKTPPRLISESGSASNPATSNLPSINFYIFIIGGMTWSEIRSVYEVIHSSVQSGGRPVQIYIGSTHVLTPSTFMKDLAALQA